MAAFSSVLSTLGFIHSFANRVAQQSQHLLDLPLHKLGSSSSSRYDGSHQKKTPMTFIYKLITGVMDIKANSEITTGKSSSPGSLEPVMAIPLRETSNGEGGQPLI